MREGLTITKSDFLVKDLDKVQPAYAESQGKMYAGRISADNGDRKGDTMFWMFEPDTQQVPDTRFECQRPCLDSSYDHVGNAWIDPAIQGPATIDYSWWHGLIDKPTRDALLDTWNRCSRGDLKDAEAPFLPFNAQDDCGMVWGILQASGHPNEYDITTFDANVDQVTFTSEAFYNTPEVKAALHAPEDHFWHGCQWGEGRRRHLMEQRRRLYMDNDRPLSMGPYIGELLDAGFPLVIYNGDRNMTTNMVGTELVLNSLEWSGKKSWLDAPRGLWKTNNYPSGWAKEHDGLTFAVVYNSGHMVRDVSSFLPNGSSRVSLNEPNPCFFKQQSTLGSIRLVGSFPHQQKLD